MRVPANDETTFLTEAPSIPGISVRRFRGKSDFPTMADVMQRSRDADLYDLVETEDDIAAEFEHLANCNPAEDMLFVEVRGHTVGFTRCEWRTEADGTRVYRHAAHLLPEWRVPGLREALVRGNERRLREVAEGHPADAPHVLEAAATYSDNPWKSLLETAGYRPRRFTLLMVRPDLDELPSLPIPEGLEVRPVQPEHHLPIWHAEDEAMRDERTYDEETWSEEGLKAFSGYHIFQPELWQIAWDGDEIAGGVLPWIDQEENAKYKRTWGYTQGIFVRKGWRNRGLASALIARAMVAVRDRGASEAALTVESENPSGALRLYEKLGYRVHTRYARYRKPLG